MTQQPLFQPPYPSPNGNPSCGKPLRRGYPPPLPEATAGCKAALARVRQAKDHLRVVMEEAEWEGFN